MQRDDWDSVDDWAKDLDVNQATEAYRAVKADYLTLDHAFGVIKSRLEWFAKQNQ